MDTQHCNDASSDAEKTDVTVFEGVKMNDEKKTDDEMLTLEEEDEKEVKEVKKEVIENDHGDFTVTKHEDMKLVTIRGKNLEFLSARREITKMVKKASFNKNFNEVNKTKFKVTNLKDMMYSTDCDVEVDENGKKGKCKVTIYKDNKKKEGKKEQTIMVTKLVKHDTKYVKIVAENIIQYLLEGFLTKNIEETEVKKISSSKTESVDCEKCGKRCMSKPGLKVHMTRAHGEKAEVKEAWFSCNQCEGKFKLEGALINHKKAKHEKKDQSNVEEDENLKRYHSASPKSERKKSKNDDESKQRELSLIHI